MGRPIKIQHYDAALGVPIDQTQPLFADFEAPVPPGGGQAFTGLVGGLASAATSASTPILAVDANLLLADGTNTGVVACSIVRQKGVRKYMVAPRATTNVSAGLIVGQGYQIVALGNTNWSAVGAPVTFAVGAVFTATAAGSGTGTVRPVATCELANTAAPTPGYMNIQFTDSGATTYYIAKLNGKFALDYTGTRWEINFFSATGSEIKSGTTGGVNTPGQQNILSLGAADNYTS
jgi:hypothetical protein